MKMIRRLAVLRPAVRRALICAFVAGGYVVLDAGSMTHRAQAESGPDTVSEGAWEGGGAASDGTDDGTDDGADQDADAVDAAPSAASGQTMEIVSIASGMPSGLYFPVAGGVAEILDSSGNFDGMTFSAESTTGSWENVVRVNSGEFDFGIARSDRVFDAVMGTGPFASSGPLADLRLLFALHDEAVTVIVGNEVEAEIFADLADARINLGPEENNPVRVALTAALEAAGMVPDAGAEGEDGGEDGGEDAGETDDGPTLLSIPLASQTQALCDGEVDAIAYIAGHPIGTVHEAITQCDARVVGFGSDVIDAVLQSHPYYKASDIPIEYYSGNAETGDQADPEGVSTLPSFGPVALMVTNAGVADDRAEAVTATVVEAIEQLQDLHPALRGVSITEILGTEFSAPLHDGALAFFRERGIQ